MKKIFNIFTVAAALFLFASCKKDSQSTNTNTGSTSVLPKKIVEVYSNYPNSPKTMDFTYSGNKISEITITPNADVSKIKYTYTGDDITKIETLVGANYAAYTSTELTYQNGKVISAINKGATGNVLANLAFTYNADNSITIKTTPTTVGYVATTKRVYLTNGNLTKEEILDNNNAVTSTYTYEYDLTKNGYAKNITGFAYTFTEADGNANNLVKKTSAIGVQTPTVENVTSTYNTDGYPTLITKPYNGSTTVTVSKTITY